MPEQAFHPEGKAGTIIKSAHLASLSVFSGGDPRVALKSEIRRPKPRGRGRFGLRPSFVLRPSAFGFDPRGYKQDDPDGVFRTQSFNVPIGIAACLMRGCFPLSSSGGVGWGEGEVVLKSEVRSPKSEGRKKAEFRNPKTETRCRGRFGLRPSGFVILSAFDLRPSDLTRVATNRTILTEFFARSLSTFQLA